MTFLAKDARRAIINRCASHLSARFAGRAFAVPAFTNDVSPAHPCQSGSAVEGAVQGVPDRAVPEVSPAASTLSLLGQRGEGVASGPCAGATPDLILRNHEVPCA